MSQPFDLSQFPDLPPEVVKAFEAAQFELSVERAARQHEQAVVAEKDAFITELKALIEKLEGQVQRKRRLRVTGSQVDGLKFHGRSSSIRFCGCPAAIASNVAFR